MSAKMKSSDSPRRARVSHTRPNCTHVTMDMSFQVAQCDLCGKYPTLGWLYQCNQDKDQEASINNGKEDLLINSADSLLVVELKSLGFSPSVIKQATSGHYTHDQLLLLKAQKANVHSVLEKQAGSSTESTSSKTNNESAALHPNITTRKHKISSPKNNPTPQNSTPSNNCALKCCHTCRPYYRDRVFGHLNSIFNDIDLAWSNLDVTNAHVLDAVLVREMGLRRPAKSLEISNISEVNQDTSTSSTDSSDSASAADALEVLTRDDFQTVAEYEEYIHRRSSSNHRVRTSHPPLETARSTKGKTHLSRPLPPRQQYLSDADKERVTRPNFKWRIARMLGRSSSSPAWLKSSNTSKEQVKTMTPPPIPPRHPARKQSDGSTASQPVSSPRGSETDVEVDIDDSRDLDFPDDSSDSSEVEVEDGVALAEAAVEELYPNIITQA